VKQTKFNQYAELACISNFTFLRGASHPHELVKRAHIMGYKALALTDECSLAGIVRAHQAATECGLHLIVGSEFQIQDGPRIILLAPSKTAYAELSRVITRCRRAADKGEYCLLWEYLDGALHHCLALVFPSREGYLSRVRDLFKNRVWLAVALFQDGKASRHLRWCKSLGRDVSIPLVAVGDVYMHSRGRRVLRDTITAIRLCRPISELGHALHANGERHLRSMDELTQLYPRSLLNASTVISERCRFSLSELQYTYPNDVVPEGSSSSQYLRKLTQQGMQQRWSEGVSDRVRQQVEHELRLIEEMQYEAYFLTVYDIVEFARSRGILCQGRGSAANSAVCYCLGITEVDPSRMELLFERFISKERNEPPDIDVDFEHQRREEVIQYIYTRYGRERAALTATVISYRLKSAIRDVGKALGLSPDQVDPLAKSVMWWDGQRIAAERLLEIGLQPDNPLIRKLMILVQMILRFPRHLSQHVGGFVIAERCLMDLVPIENASMPERTVIQWDKDDLDTLGILKVDCLCLGMLSAIHKAFDLVEKIRGKRWTMATIPAEDVAVYQMIQQADTIGVFQIESRAQMSMLPRLRPENFYDLVIEVALVRPGPIQGDMVHPYLRRRQGLEAVEYPSEAIRAVLERTLGVPIFQEQVIKVAMVAAGFSPGEADQLRRSMAAWRRHGDIECFEQRLVEGMRARGYDEDFAQRIFNQIKGFGEYGFPESHAASFALLVYVSAWLKRHEPAAFFCGILNSLPMGFYAPSQLVQDARKHQVEVRPVDVRFSEWDCTLETDTGDMHRPALRLGLRRIKGLSRQGGERVVASRSALGSGSVEALAWQASLDRHDLQCLAKANALVGVEGNRHQAHWAVSGVEAPTPLFTSVSESATPMLRPPTEGENITADYASLGLTLGRHPLALLRDHRELAGVQPASQVSSLRHGVCLRVAGLVINRQRPGAAANVTFMTLEDESGQVNVVVWAALAERQRAVLLGSNLLEVYGELQREGEVQHVIARRLTDRSRLLGRLRTHSRDFH